MNLPVLRFGSPDCVLAVFSEEADLYSCTQNSFKYLNAMKQFYVVDSSGNRFDLSNPKFKDKLSIWDKITGVFSIRMYPITWIVKENGKVTLNELKDLIRNDFLENISVWQAIDYETIKKNVEKADTVMEVFEVMGSE